MPALRERRPTLRARDPPPRHLNLPLKAQTRGQEPRTAPNTQTGSQLWGPNPHPCPDAPCTQDPTPGDPIHCPLRPHVSQPATVLETLGRLRWHLERTAGLLFGQGLGHHVQVSWQQRQVGRDAELNRDWGDQGMGACDCVTGGTLRPRCGCSQNGTQVWRGLPSLLTPRGQKGLREDFRDGGRTEQMEALKLNGL